MKLAMRLTLDGLVRALKRHAYQLADDGLGERIGTSGDAAATMRDRDDEPRGGMRDDDGRR